MFLGGSPNNVYEFYKIKKKYNSYLLEDACHAFGSIYKVGNKKYNVGECKHSDFAVFSFHPVKTITTGEGGAICSNLKIISDKIRSLISHGMIKKYYWDYDINSLSFNFRLSDINCALGNSQLNKINFIINKRKKIFDYYLKHLNNFEDIIKIIKPEKKTKPSYHLVIALINFEKLKINKDKFFQILNKKKIFCQFHYIPNYRFKNFKQNYSLKGSEMYYKTGISLPIHLKLKKSDIKYVIENIKNTIIKWKKN